jgi:hypothetical protein
MLPPQSSSHDELEDECPFVEIRYSLPELLRDVKRDRGSVAFAMEKLDQAAINTLFEQQQSRHGSGLRQ